MIARESQDAAEVVQVEVRHGDVSGFGEAAPIERYARVGRVGARLARGGRARRRSRGRSTRSPAGLPPGRAGRAGRSRRGAPRPPGEARRACRSTSCSGCARQGPPTSWTIWLGDPDDMARRAEEAAARGFRRLKLKLGGARRARPRARAARSARVDRPAAPGRRQRVLVARRGARATCRRCELQYCEQPLPARRPGRARS